MTATSEGDFSLMSEALNLSGMTDPPAIIVLGQRPGPARTRSRHIGYPTKNMTSAPQIKLANQRLVAYDFIKALS